MTVASWHTNGQCAALTQHIRFGMLKSTHVIAQKTKGQNAIAFGNECKMCGPIGFHNCIWAGTMA